MTTCIYEDCDLDAIYCEGHAIEMNNTQLLQKHIATMEDLLEDIKEFLAGQEDVDDGDYGIPEANKAMRLNMRIKELIG